MDFTPELLAFQGVIMSADNKTPFARISSRGGNEEQILSIVKSLYKFFQDKQYFAAEGILEAKKCEIRKISLYLVLNTDFSALEKISELPNVGHLVWTTPVITKCLLCEIVFGLKIEYYMGEIISYSDPKLSVELLKTLVNGIRYVSAQSSIEKLHELSVASYRCLCRLTLFSYDAAVTALLLSDLFNNFLRSITHFVSPPNNGKLEELSEDDQYVHLGIALRSLLDVTLVCLSEFGSTHQLAPNSLGDFYLATVEIKDIKTNKPPKNVSESNNEAVLEYLQKCNIALLDKCVELVMRVSVDVFCCWSEHEMEGKTLQRIVGEMSHRLLHKLEIMKDFSEHTLVGMLPPICCKPIDIFDVIAEADDDTMIANASSNTEERKLWLNAIIDRSHLYENEALMDCLFKHSTLLNPESCEKLFKRTIRYLKENKYDNEIAKTLAASCFVGVNAEKKCDLMIDLFDNRVLHNLMETKHFESKMNEKFNKLISTSDYSLYDFFDVFLQNPYAVYKKMLNTGIENSKQASLMLDVCIMLSPFSEYCCDGEKESALVRAIEELRAETLETEVQQNSFVSLLSGISREITVVQNRMLLLIIMPNIHKCMVNKQISRLQLYLRLLGRAYEASELVRWRAPLLAMLAQVLEAVRWNFTSYSSDAPSALQEAIDLQASLMATYALQIPEKDSNWLKLKLKTLKPLNMYYFKDIWNPPGKTFIQVLTDAVEVKPDDYPILLAKILNCCTRKEWVMVWESLVAGGDQRTALEFFYQALILMTLAERSHRSYNSQLCLHYCYRNFTSILKEQYLSDASEKANVENVLEKFVELSNLTSEEDIEDIGNIMLPLLANLTGKKRSIDDVSHVEVANRLKHGKFAKLVGEVFTNAAS